MKTYPKFQSLLLLVVVLLVTQTCISSYEAPLRLDADLLVINAIITDQPTTQTITLSQSRSTGDTLLSIPLQQAAVTVLVDGTPLVLSETEPGIYTLPTGFRGQAGHSYQLRFVTAAGQRYQSTVETITPAPPIKRAYALPHDGLVPVRDTLVPASDIYIDYDDPAATANFYMWRWRNYEVQEYCASCKQGRYVIRDVGAAGSGPLEVIGCVVDPLIKSYVYFDYPCRGQCWDIIYSSRIDVLADVYTNGRSQVGHLIATIPAYQEKPALIVIDQLAISAGAYRYYRLFAEQVQNSGTLADSPPAPLAGNVRNVDNPVENVVGYFSMASSSTYTYKYTRSNLTITKFIGLFRSQTGRFPRPEEDRTDPVFGAIRPSALCVDSPYRTNQSPSGW